MGISFKVGKVGTRYRPRPVQDDVQENDNGGGAPVADNQSRKRLSTDKFSRKGDKVADHANVPVKSEQNLASEEMEVSFSLNLFTNGFSVAKASEHFNCLPKQLYPYDRASNALFTAIEYGWLPGDIFGDISCIYNNGAVLCEIRDYRHRSYEKAGVTCIVNSPVVHKVLLQMCMENIIRDILSISDDSWTYKDLLEVESCLLKALQPDLHLNPEPLLDKFSRAPMKKKLDLGIKWGWKKRKQNSATATNSRLSSQNPGGVPCLQTTATSFIPNAPPTNPRFCSQNQRGVPCPQRTVSSSTPNAPATNPRFSSQNLRGVPYLQPAVTSSIPKAPATNPRFSCHNHRGVRQPIDLEKNDGLLESVVQHPLTVVSNYQSVDSCSQSVAEDLTSRSFSSVTTQSFGIHDSKSREPSSFVVSQQGRGDTQAVQKPVLKIPKLETVDFSEQLHAWNQSSPLSTVPNYQLVDSCSPALGDLTSLNPYSVRTQRFSKDNWESGEPNALVCSPQGGCELQAVQRTITKIPKQEPVDFSHPWSQPNPVAMVPNYQLAGSCSQSVGDLTSSSLSTVPIQCFSNSDSREPRSFGLAQPGRCPGSQPNALAMVSNYQLVNSCSQPVLRDLTSSNLSSVPLQCFSNCESRDPSSLVCSQMGGCELLAIQRPGFKIPKQEIMDFSSELPPVNQPNPLEMVPNYQLLDSCSQSVIGDLNSSGLSSFSLQYFSKLNSQSTDPGSLVHSHLGRFEMQAIQRSALKMPKQEAVEFSYQQPTGSQPYPLAMGFSKRNSSSGEPSSLVHSHLGRCCEAPAIYRPITKIPKQEPVDFSRPQLPGSQPELIFAAGMQQNLILHQQPGGKMVPGENFQDKRGQLQLISDGQPAILEGVPKLHAGMSTTVGQEPAGTKNFSSLDVTRIKDGYLDVDTSRNRSDLQQLQPQGSSPMLGTYASLINSPWNQLANDRNVRKEVVTHKRKVLQSPQITAGVSIAPSNSYQSESLRREASVPAKRKKNCHPRGSNTEISDSLSVVGNTSSTISSSIKFGSGHNSNESVASNLQVGNSFNSNAIIGSLQMGKGYNSNATVASSIQAGKGYNSSAIAGSLHVENSYSRNQITAGSLQEGNGYNWNAAVASSLQAGNGYNSNAVAGSFQAGNSYKSNEIVAGSLQVGNGYNTNAIAGSLHAGNSYNSNEIVAGSLQVGDSCNLNATVASSLHAGNDYNMNATIEGRLQVGNSCNLSVIVSSSLQVGNGYNTNTNIEDILLLGEDYDTNSNTASNFQFGDFNLFQTSEVGDIQRFEKIKEVTQRYELHDRKHKFDNSALVIFKLWNSESWKSKDVSTGIDDRGFGVVKTRTLTFMCQSHFQQGNEIPIVDNKSCVKLVMSKKLTVGFVETTVFYEYEEGIGPTVIPIPPTLPSTHFLDQFTAQFISLMAREGYCLVCDHIQPSLLNDDNSSSSLNNAVIAGVPPVAIALGMIPGLTPGLSTSMLISVGDEISASYNCRQLPSKNLNSGSHLFLLENIQSFQQNSGNNLLKLQLDNTAAQMSPGQQPHWQQTFSNQAQLQLQMMQRQRQQDQLMLSMKMMQGVSTAVGGLGTANSGGGVHRGNRNSGHGSFSNSMGIGGSAATPTLGQIPSTGNVSQFNHFGSSSIPSSTDSKQRIVGGMSDSVAAVLAELRTVDVGQGRSSRGGIPFWNNSVQMHTPNIQDVAYLLPNQQITTRNQQQQEMGSVAQPQIRGSNFANTVSLPNRVPSQQFYNSLK